MPARVAAPAFLEKHRVARALDVLAVPCAGFRAGPEYKLAWTLGDRALAPSPVVLANDYAQLRALALAGDVLTELPPFLAAVHVANGDLVHVLPRTPFPEMTITAIVPERRHTTSLVRAWLELCAARAPALLRGDAGSGDGLRGDGARAARQGSTAWSPGGYEARRTRRSVPQ